MHLKPFNSPFFFLSLTLGLGMVPLRALTVLSENPGSIPSSRVAHSSRVSNTLFQPLGHVINRYTCGQNTHMHKIDKFLKILTLFYSLRQKGHVKFYLSFETGSYVSPGWLPTRCRVEDGFELFFACLFTCFWERRISRTQAGHNHSAAAAEDNL